MLQSFKILIKAVRLKNKDKINRYFCKNFD